MKARLYRHEDERDLLRLASVAMPGWVRLRYDYASGYAAAEALKGDCDIVVVGGDDGHVAGCGTRSTRLLYLDGEPQKVGYLSGLRSFTGPRGGFGFYRGLMKLRELEDANPNELTFTTILNGNADGRALLTSGRAGLPEYHPHGWVITYALGTIRGMHPEMTSFDELKEFYARESPRKQLFPVFREALQPGLSVDDFFVIRRAGRIAAAGAVWNHGDRRRIVVDGYDWRIRFLRSALNAVFAISGSPRLPSPGCEFSCSYLAYALAENDNPELFAELLDAARHICRGRNLVLSLHSEDPLARVAMKLGGWRYGSEFLTVGFEERSRSFDGAPYIEAGAL